MVLKELSNKQFIHLLQMMAGQDEGGYGEVFREAARRLNEFESKMVNVNDFLKKLNGMEG